MNRLLQAAMEPGKTLRRVMQIARGYLYWSPAGIERNAGGLWARSGSDEHIRDLSHWYGEGRWADRDKWERIGQRHFDMFEKLCLLADVTQPIQSMVEWGPGGGLNAVCFCATVPVFYGVDISAANLAECQRQVEARGLEGFRPVLIDIDKLEQCIELVEQPVDFFLSTAVYQHFPSKEHGIRVTELAARLLADEGVALIQIRYDDGSPRLKAKKRNYEKNVIYFTSYNIDEFWQIAIDAGLEPLAVSLNPKIAYAYFFLKKEDPMVDEVLIGERAVGDGHPVYIIAEIGINHNGELDVAKKLIDAAMLAGCDAVKFQKRTPELCVPAEQADVVRETPWGPMTYMEYRHRVEFGQDEYSEIDRYCKEKNIAWFASCWDEPSVDFMEHFAPACYKIASASLTDVDLLKHVSNTGRSIILSTGMSTMEEIHQAVSLLDQNRLLIAHCTGTYPCKPNELNLLMIQTLRQEFHCPVGYSGHEVGLQTTYAAVVLGASFVERHITLDRAMWGSDQAASVEPWGFMRLVRDIRVIEEAMGDGVKTVYDSEMAVMSKLRRFGV